MEKMTLSEAIPGNSYFIREIKDEIRLTNRLSSMGILAGTRIEVCQNHKKQSVLLFASDTLVAICLLYTSPSPRDGLLSRMPSSA